MPGRESPGDSSMNFQALLLRRNTPTPTNARATSASEAGSGAAVATRTPLVLLPLPWMMPSLNEVGGKATPVSALLTPLSSPAVSSEPSVAVLPKKPGASPKPVIV